MEDVQKKKQVDDDAVLVKKAPEIQAGGDPIAQTGPPSVATDAGVIGTERETANRSKPPTGSWKRAVRQVKRRNGDR